MTILGEIINNKRKEVFYKKQLIPTSQLEQSVLFERDTNSLVNKLQYSDTGIIAEYKRRSPSKPIIGQKHAISEVVKSYINANVCGISVLTDSRYFGGSLEDLLLARAISKNMPLLRKDFIIDYYQLLEAKAYGADIVLLIATTLNKKEIKHLSEFAKNLHLEVLLEIHHQDELDKSLLPSIDILGVNNRNLKTFAVNIETSKSLANKIPSEFVKISESGIREASQIKTLRSCGYQGFLIGENFMTTDYPGKSATELIQAIIQK